MGQYISIYYDLNKIIIEDYWVTFPLAIIKCPDKGDSREKGFVFPHTLKVQFIIEKTLQNPLRTRS